MQIVKDITGYKTTSWGKKNTPRRIKELTLRLVVTNWRLK
jgi:hypothetical protein